MEMNSNGITYGYIRVSTTFQNDDRQWLAMDVVFLLVKISGIGKVLTKLLLIIYKNANQGFVRRQIYHRFSAARESVERGMRDAAAENTGQQTARESD